MWEGSKVIQRAQQRLAEEEHQLLLGADNEDVVKYWAAYLDGAKAQQKENDHYEQLRIAEEVKGYIPKAYKDW